MNEQDMIAILKNPHADRTRVAKLREQIGCMDRNSMSPELMDAYLNS